jgi:DNA-binding MarR family transcriptional regulator
MDHVPLDRLFCFALYRAGQAMQQTYRPLLEPLGLTYPQFLVLTALWGQDGQTVGALGQALGLDTGTLTPLLKRLAAAGFLRRTRDSADERRVMIHLTEQGRALAAASPGLAAQIDAATGLPPAAIEDFAAILRDLARQLRDNRPQAQAAASATTGSGSSSSA